MNSVLLSFVLLSVFASCIVCQQCSSIDSVTKRIDCFPDAGASQEKCQLRGCCWQSADKNPGLNSDVPWCFYPSDYATYTISDSKQTDYGHSATLKISGNDAVIQWPNKIRTLSLEVHHFPVSKFVRVRIFDPANKRYEVPDKFPAHDTEKAVASPSVFPTSVQNDAKGIVIRDEQNRVLFDSTIAPLLFTDQFIQFSTWINSSYAYGLGEVSDFFAKPTNSWRKYTLFATDSAPGNGTTVYGIHPFGMFMRPDASSYGMFFLNSNAMDVEITPYPALTFRTIGGIIDLFLYAGSTPDAVVKQHLTIVGYPIMPPYWGLGFHLSRWGYNSEENMRKAINRTFEANMPFDVQWFDIDTFHGKRDWTIDPVNFPTLKNLVTELHNRQMRVIPIVDPAIQVLPGYKPYERGVELNVFMKDSAGNTLVGEVWPGNTTFPDFTHENASTWWYEDALEYYNNLVKYDGLWIDMNEPANFVHGSVNGCPKNNTYDYPPFTPALKGENGILQKTVCMSAKHKDELHYNMHSVYGHIEAQVTNEIVRRIIPKKRPFVLTRSSFAGTGRYAHHWTGDVGSEWEYVDWSIGDMLNFNLFGMPFVGADVCGFWHNATEEMCVRWTQLGSFYPFMRNHNCEGFIDQDPGVWSTSAQNIMRNVLLHRYSLIPYYYTLHWRASTFAETVVRPLFWNFPNDKNTWGINSQFMMGGAILVSPVVLEKQVKVQAYVPSGRWYLPSGEQVTVSGSVQLDVPIDHIPVHYRGGYVLPMQYPNITTEHSRKNPYYIVVATDEKQSASGELYIDDGDSDAGSYSHISFLASEGKFSSTPVKADYKPSTTGYSEKVNLLRVFGVPVQPEFAHFNNVSTGFSYNSTTKVLEVAIDANIIQSFSVTWGIRSSTVNPPTNESSTTGWSETTSLTTGGAGALYSQEIVVFVALILAAFFPNNQF